MGYQEGRKGRSFVVSVTDGDWDMELPVDFCSRDLCTLSALSAALNGYGETGSLTPGAAWSGRVTWTANNPDKVD